MCDPGAPAFGLCAHCPTVGFGYPVTLTRQCLGARDLKVIDDEPLCCESQEFSPDPTAAATQPMYPTRPRQRGCAEPIVEPGPSSIVIP